MLAVAWCCAFLGHLAGQRHQQYTQARADVRDTHDKLGKARKTRSTLRAQALAGWLGLAAVLVLLLAVALAEGSGK